jgi:hypothetical protein
LSALSDTSKYDAAVQRITATAMTDDGYRAQLVTLADSHQGIYRRALDAVYASERESLDQQEAQARVAHDEQLLAETRERERKRKALAELEHAGTLAEAADQAIVAARALRDHTKAKLVRLAGEDEDLRRRLVALANKRKGIYQEALEQLAG